MSNKSKLDNAMIDAEIEVLKHDEDVKLAKAEMRKRQQLYNLRWLKKRGAELRAQGYTVAGDDDNAEIHL